jgi:hypothetical protein
MSMCALFARSASPRRIGTAWAAISLECELPLGSAIAVTSVSRPPVSVIRTCTGPYCVVMVWPVAVTVRLDAWLGVPAGAAEAVGGGA